MTRALQSDCVKITISKENYLKAIAEAESEGETVIAATLTRWLGVSAPAVTMAIKRLKRDGFIRVGKEGQITLTPGGTRDRRAPAAPSPSDGADYSSGFPLSPSGGLRT